MEHPALVILKKSGELFALSPGAEQILSPDDTRRLAEITSVGLAPLEEGRLIRWDRPGGQAPWLLSITDMRNGGASPSYRAITIYRTRSRFDVDPEVLIALYRLTKAEVRLAQQIIEGHSPLEAARQMGVTIHTVRTYLKRLYLKVGVKTQAALVRKLLGCSIQPDNK